MERIRVYIPVKEKSKIRGYWQGNGKLYKDNIIIEKLPKISKIKLLFYCQKYNQLAIFYTKNGQGYIYTAKTGRVDVLKSRRAIQTGRAGLKNNIKAFLKQYNGLTIYVNKGVYTLEAFYNV